MPETPKIILDLCGGTGAWSRPYADAAGYDVRIITHPKNDVHGYFPPDNVYGILAAPPCTHFSFARQNAKTPRNFRKGLYVVDECLRIIRECALPGGLKFWALENPRGYLRRFLGKPPFEFNPCDFGDSWTKRTDLWGVFNLPHKNPVAPVHRNLNWEHRYLPSPPEDYCKKIGGDRRKTRRAMTPAGFAQAFFKANR